MKPGRNDPCPCGSGRKYKKCCEAAGQSRPGPDAGRLVAESEEEYRHSRLDRAGQLCAKALAQEPRHAGALHMTGVLAIRAGQEERAVELIREAISLDPAVAIYHSNLGAALKTLGRLEEAAGACREALRLDPTFAAALANLGGILKDLGKPAEALPYLEQASALNPSDTALLDGLGAVLKTLGRLEEAVAACRKVLLLDPACTTALNHLGGALRDLGKPEVGLPYLEKAVALNPSEPYGQINLGMLLQDLKRPEEALEHYRTAARLFPQSWEAARGCAQALAALERWDEAEPYGKQWVELMPEDIEAHQVLGICDARRKRYDEAAGHFVKMSALHPTAAGLNNLAACHSGAGRWMEAFAFYRQALDLDPMNSEVLGNMGMSLKGMGDTETALEYLEKALVINPDNFHARWHRALCLLGTGRLAEGWQEYEMRFEAGTELDMPKERKLHPRWDGSDLMGKTILVSMEQGIGDHIVMASMLPDLQRTGARCIVECDPRLIKIMERSFPGVKAYPLTNPPHPRVLEPDIDFGVPAASLPGWFRTTFDSFPQHRGYLLPDPHLASQWKQILAALGNGLKVGICWRSMVNTGTRAILYSKLDEWGPILAVPGVHFVNLQYDQCEEELREVGQRFGVPFHNWEGIDLKNDQENVAAIIAGLDLVISAGTAVDVLASAMGKPAWGLTRGCTDWWNLGREDCPWFPSARSFNCRGDEPWDGTIHRLASAFREFVDARLTPAARSNRVKELYGSGIMAARAGNNQQAEKLLREALVLDPAVAAHHDALGSLLKGLGRLEEAAEACRQAVQLDPDCVSASINLGGILFDLGKPQEALPHLERAAAGDAANGHAHMNLGLALHALGRKEEALAHVQTAVERIPGLPGGVRTCTMILAELNRWTAAAPYAGRWAEQEPENSMAHLVLATCWGQQSHWDEAMPHYQRAYELTPNSTTANKLGVCLEQRGLGTEALFLYVEAVERNPGNAEARTNLGAILKSVGQAEAGLEQLDAALALQPANANAHWNRALCLLALGKPAEGWAEYEWRWKLDTRLLRPFSYPVWNGSDPSGKTILVWMEQGLGDHILLAGMIPDLLRAGAHGVVECDPRLVTLLQRSFPGVETIPMYDPPQARLLQPDIDFQIAAASLARWFRPSIESFPQHRGYLVPDPERVRRWSERLEALGEGPKVGICWRSMNNQKRRSRHYSQLSQWGPILTTPGIRFVNLQYDQCEEELREAERLFGTHVHVWDDVDLKDDQESVAALIAGLDLLISAPTAVAQIAGALGNPAWVLTRGLSDVWGLGTDHCPWHPSIRSFHCPSGEPWEPALEEIAFELRKWAAARRAAESQPLDTCVVA